MLRIIREEEPPKPSTRLSTEKTVAQRSPPTVASEPARLSGLVRGELDWIVMKALEKDRNRRYETANGLAADIQRYLNDETVQACPPSAVVSISQIRPSAQAWCDSGRTQSPSRCCWASPGRPAA